MCGRCGHEMHTETALGGLGPCESCTCPRFYQEVEAIGLFLCGECGSGVQDYGLHDAWHAVT